MKEVNLSFETFHKIFRYIEDRLLNYSTLAHSKHETLVRGELQIAPQFTLNLQEAGCAKEELEFILNFLAFHNNDRNSPIGIFYQSVQSEYTVQTKTEKMALLLENICHNASNKTKYSKFLQFISDKNNADTMAKILLRNFSIKEPTIAYELCRRNTKIERTNIRCFDEKEVIEMEERRRLYAKIEERETIEAVEKTLEAEKEKIARENQIKEQTKKTIIDNTQSKGGKNRLKDKPVEIVKLYVIKPLYLSKKILRSTSVRQKAIHISDLINKYSNQVCYINGEIKTIKERLKTRKLHHQTREHLEKELETLEAKMPLSIKTAIDNLKDILHLEQNIAKQLIEYCKTKEEIYGQIYKWCLKIDKGAL